MNTWSALVTVYGLSFLLAGCFGVFDPTENKADTASPSPHNAPAMLMLRDFVLSPSIFGPSQIIASINVTLENSGGSSSAAGRVTLHRSNAASVSSADALVGQIDYTVLAANAATAVNWIDIAAPSVPGRYYYAACLATGCSNSQPLTVVDVIDSGITLSAFSLSPNDRVDPAGLIDSMSVLVTNTTANDSAEGTVYFYRSLDASVDRADTLLSSVDYSALAAGLSTTVTLNNTSAPAAPNYYYYAACLDSSCSRAAGIKTRLTVAEAGAVDIDGDGLIELSGYGMLNNMRHDLAGSAYKTSATDTGSSIGCPLVDVAGSSVPQCHGYEFNADISASGTQWVPVGSESAPFTGTLSGNGHRLTFISIFSNLQYSGLFSVLEGSIRDITFEDFHVNRTNIYGNATYAGTAVGHMKGRESRLENITLISNDVYGSNSADVIGGLVGLNEGTIDTCQVFGSSVDPRGGDDQAGGLVGNNATTGIIRHCSLINPRVFNAPSGNDSLGGLVGENQGTIEDSHFTGGILGSNGQDTIGGLSGVNAGVIINSHVRSLVTTETSSGTVITNIRKISGGSDDDIIGGLVGRNQSAGSIRRSYASIYLEGDSGSDTLGGLVGDNAGLIGDSYAAGDLSGGDFGDLIGGLAGQNQGLSSDSLAAIYTSYSLVDGNAGTNYTADRGGRFVGALGEHSDIAQNYFFKDAVLTIHSSQSPTTLSSAQADGLSLDHLRNLDQQQTDTDDGDNGNGWDTNHWQFSELKFPTLKRDEGNLLCGQGPEIDFDYLACP